MAVNQQNSEDTPQRNYRDFYAYIQESLVANLTRALRVAGGVSSNGEILNMSKGDLATLSDLSKGTVTKLTSTVMPEEAKPDLETLCKLAYTLNISPAFLLMTHRDWDLLIQALGTLDMFSAQQGEAAKPYISILKDAVNAQSVDKTVIGGLEFMKRLNKDEYSSDERQRQQKGILAMTALAQSALKRKGLNREMQATALGAILGDRDLSQNI